MTRLKNKLSKTVSCPRNHKVMAFFLVKNSKRQLSFLTKPEKQRYPLPLFLHLPASEVEEFSKKEAF